MGQSTRGGPAAGTGEDPLRALLSSIRDMVLVRNAEGTLTYCSPAVFVALGYHPAELEGTKERDLVHPAVKGIVTNARDVTERRAENAQLRECMLRDPLTGIPNRLALNERLTMALSRSKRARDVVAVLFCDLDDFKVVNDTFGHEF